MVGPIFIQATYMLHTYVSFYMACKYTMLNQSVFVIIAKCIYVVINISHKYIAIKYTPIWNFLGCSNLAATLQHGCYNKLALFFARCTQPCDYPWQGTTL